MALKRVNIEKPEWEESNRTLVMFTAIMLILVSFFILLVSQANFDETKHQEALDSINRSFGFMQGGDLLIGEDSGTPFEVIGPETGIAQIQDVEMAKIRALLAPAIMDREARLIHAQGQKIVSLSASLLFEPDGTELKPEAGDKLLALARIMAQNNIPLAVHGHTDNQPPKTQGVGDNWDISTKRAVSVLNFLATYGQLDIKRLSAFGYAGTKPYYSNNTPANRAKNNRIDLVLDFEKISAKDLEKFREKTNKWDFKGFEFLVKETP